MHKDELTPLAETVIWRACAVDALSMAEILADFATSGSDLIDSTSRPDVDTLLTTLTTIHAALTRVKVSDDVKCNEAASAKRLSEMAARLKSTKYDPDNHVGSCGCVVENGRRTYWCGDHY